MLSLVVGALVALPPAAPLLFDVGDGRWLLMSRSGETIKVVSGVAGKRPRDAAISPDGKAWSFISDDRLFLWREGWKLPREVPRAGDVLEWPAFSPDGKWVYFTQNDFATMRMKAPMRYSQIWRVSSEGGTPQKLTRSNGCHMWPRPLSGGRALVTHATCRGGRSIDLLSADGTEESLLGTENDNGEAELDPTGTKVVLSREAQGTEFHILDLATKQAQFWARVPWRTGRLRPALSADGQSIWFQNQEAIWRAEKDGSVSEHITFAKLEGAK